MDLRWPAGEGMQRTIVAALMQGDGGFAALLLRAKAGDEAAIADIYRRHHGRLLRVLRAEVGDAADDVASQAWLEVFSALRRFEGDERGFRSFLFTIARRRVADHRRTTWRRPSTPVAPDSLHETVDRAGPLDDSVIAGLDGEEVARRITVVLGHDNAEVVLLRIVAGLSVDEVARIVGRTPGAVRVQQHRALRKLAEALAEGALDVAL